MTQSENVEIDLEKLLHKVRGRVRRPTGQHLPGGALTPLQGGGSANFHETGTQSKKIGDSLNLIRRYSRVRTELPRSLERFPINRIALLRKLLLKGHEFLFREQRAVNNAIADALVEIRRMGELSSDVFAHVRGLESTLKTLEARTNDLHTAALTPRTSAPPKSNDTEGTDSLLAALAQIHQDGRDDPKDGWRDYLAIIRQARGGTAEHPVLDIGCGRGDWLELLKQEDLHGRGVDTNRVFVEECVKRGLQAEYEDAVAYLQGLPEGRLGAVTGFHVIEYLPFESLVRLLDNCLRVLKSGGVAIFETHDPDCLMRARSVSSLDPMPHNLLAAPVLKGIAEMRGFADIEVRHLYPAERVFDSPDGDTHLADQLNALFGGPQVYAILGYRP